MNAFRKSGTMARLIGNEGNNRNQNKSLEELHQVPNLELYSQRSIDDLNQKIYTLNITKENITQVEVVESKKK